MTQSNLIGSTATRKKKLKLKKAVKTSIHDLVNAREKPRVGKVLRSFLLPESVLIETDSTYVPENMSMADRLKRRQKLASMPQ